MGAPTATARARAAARAATAAALAATAACGSVTAGPDGAAPDAAATADAPAAADAADRAAAIRAVIDGAVAGPMAQPGAVGLAIGVLDGRDRVLAFYGETTRGNHTPPTAATLFEVGSITKTVTATLLAYEVTQGTVALADPLDGYLPAAYQFGASSPKHAITLVELADHTSGLPRNPTDVAAGAGTYTFDQLDADADALTLGATPGATFVYSNLAYALLGEALADVAGVPWRTAVQQDITGPLGMADTDTYADLTAAQLARVATGYADAAVGACTTPPCPVSPSLILAAFPAPAVNPAGGLYASPADLMTWLAYNEGAASSSALDPLLPMLRQPRVAAGGTRMTGLAWNHDPLVVAGATHDEISKDGDTNGFHAFIAYVPDLHLGVFVVANFAITTSPQALGQQILAALPPAS